jgi:sugar O-acyltransferase (sialic acid O-acetyltransferase NeuD family)
VGSGLILVAASGLALEAAEAARAAGVAVQGCVDDNPDLTGRLVGGWLPVLGGLELCVAEGDSPLLLCAGRGSARRAIGRRLAERGVARDRFASVVHPNVEVPASCSVGAGSILLAGVVLTAAVTIGDHVVAMPHVTLTHDDVVADYATLCAGVTLGGQVQVGEAAYLGMASSVRERVAVGAEATLGMGAVLTRDLPPGEIWAGVPARLFEPSRAG